MESRAKGLYRGRSLDLTGTEKTVWHRNEGLSQPIRMTERDFPQVQRELDKVMLQLQEATELKLRRDLLQGDAYWRKLSGLRLEAAE